MTNRQANLSRRSFVGLMGLAASASTASALAGCSGSAVATVAAGAQGAEPVSAASSADGADGVFGDTIKVGILHSLSGTMAISETSVRDAEVGKFADLVLWNPAFFGSRPDIIVKGGMIVASKMGDANASIPTTEPVTYRHMFAADGLARATSCLTFVSQAALDLEVPKQLGLQKRCVAVHNCRNIGKKDMRLNDATPSIEVDPETYKVTVDGEIATCEPARKLPLTQLYNLF